MRGLRFAGVALMAALASGCGGRHDAVASAPEGIPVAAPSIRGQVTAREGDRQLRIEADPAAESGSDKAVVTLTDATRVWHRDGSAATAGEIAVGTTISAWFSGPVRESYPVQADAGVLVIEP